MGLKTFLTDHVPGYNAVVLPYHTVKATAAAVRYRFPARKMTVIGVTGTNGKTSTCFMIWKMLNEAGYKTGLCTTVAWGGVPGMKGDGPDGLHEQFEHMTTADSFTLNKRINAIAKAGAEFLVLEVTSHALAQHRILGMPIEVAVMTNVTHEHLDYHKTFERYRDAKRKLFKRAKYGIVNADDKSAAYFLTDCKEHLTYGVKKGQLRARDVELTASGVKYTCGDIKITRSKKAVGATDGSDYAVSEINIETQIPGEFNVYNSLAATAVGLRLGLTESQIEKGIKALSSVEGRMNRVDEGQNFDVIVDYAHTPGAFTKLFPMMRASCRGRLMALFGSAGERDTEKRPIQGEIASRYCDILILADEDPRGETSMGVIDDIAAGVVPEFDRKNLYKIPDRTQAIEKAVSLAKKGDTILLLGKGHESTIIYKDGPIPWDERTIAEQALKKLR